ncbi:acyltransferase [Nocardioides marmoriginsengisoli]|uniref:Acyltransferase n=1 Tax=Nocardioides marmoriginsengisoli TaxID=661483 RepID=A0A3N0CR06_9ACTN|nr:acyltransferase family protein [Nocardioides marmoriginsengisoli]RNL65769.1 acyltransferase [Nocardioides marmoriginsengisoli]
MWKYLPQLDGLRAIAVYLVLIYHANHVPGGPGYLSGGFIGVDLFFVLSGFLVSNVILSEIDKRGTFDLGGFYARRVRRLLPAAVLVIVATMIAFVVVADVVRRIEMIGDARSALLYVANWHFLGQQTDYFSQDLEPSPFLHFWSLAIEEQFYVFFPLLLILLVKAGKSVTRRLTVILTVLLVASVASQLYWSSENPTHAYYGSDSRLYQLLAGVLLALALRHSTKLFEGRRGAVIMLGGIVGLLVFASGLIDASATWRGFGGTVASVALIGSMTVLPTAWLSRLLSGSVPVYLGKISYGTYLWHWPVILVLREVLPGLGGNGVALFAFVLSSGLAALSYQVFEMPIRTNKRLVKVTWPTVVAGLTTSALVAVFVVSPVLDTDRRPALVASTGAPVVSTKIPGDGPVPGGIDWKKEVKDVGKSKYCTADDLDACMVVKDNGPLVLVVGDSFANMLGPMFVQLAKDHHFSLAQNVVQGCPWPNDLADHGQQPELVTRCAASRGDWMAKALAELKPALVVTVMKPRDPKGEYTGKSRLVRTRSGALADAPLSEVMWSTMKQTVDQIQAAGADVLMVQSVMDAYPDRPLECLAKATRLSQCAVKYPTTLPPSDGYMQALAAAVPGASTISLNKVVCPTPPTCVPYRNGQIVFRDRHHIMTGFAVANRKKIWALMTAAGATRGLG